MNSFDRFVFGATLPCLFAVAANCTTAASISGPASDATSGVDSTTDSADVDSISDSAVTVDASAPQSAAEIAAALLDAVVARHTRCNPGPDALMQPRDEEFAALLRALVSAPGTTDAQRDLSAQCSRELKVAACGGYPESCRYTKLNGTLATGAACLVGPQCQSGACSATATQCGVCAPVGTASAGMACGNDLPKCATGLSCISGKCGTWDVISAAGADCTAANQYCNVGLVCAALESDGGPEVDQCFVLGSEGQACSRGRPCDHAGTFGCSPTSNTCVALAGLGAGCAQSSDCVAGLLCDSSDLRCRSPRTGVTVGSACELGDLCASGAKCSVTADAGTHMSCVLALPLGADCSQAATLCGAGLACGASKTCVKLLEFSDCI